NAVHVVSARNVWAVGVFASTPGKDKTLILHWNGKRWARLPSPSPGSGNNVLNGVTATGRTNAWAVGLTSGSLSSRSLILRWNGRSWKQAANKAGKSELLAVTATSARNAWAVG